MRQLWMYTAFLLLAITSKAQTEFRFKNLSINDGLSQSSVTTIVQDNLNALWFGTQDGLNRYDGKSFEIFTSDETEGLESEYITCGIKDKKGNLWFGTNNGLTHYSQALEKFETFHPEKHPAFNIQDIAEDAAGNIWIASAEAGIYRYSPKTKKFESYSGMLKSQKTRRLEVVDSDKLVVATEEGWVYVCQPSSKTSYGIDFSRKFGSGMAVNNIVSHGDESVIIATNRGAFELNVLSKEAKPLFEALNKAFGPQSISDVLFESTSGWLICTNNNGLFFIDTKQHVQHYEEDIFQKSALLFNELNEIFRDASGTVWIGSQRGLSSFNPAQRGIMGIGPSGNADRGIPTASVWSFAEDPEGKYVFIGTDRAVTRYTKATGKFRQYEREKKETTYGTGEMAVLALEVINPYKLLVGCADGFFELTIGAEEIDFRRIPIESESGRRHDRVYRIVHWKDNLYWLATKDGAILYDEFRGVQEIFEHNPSKSDRTISKGICRNVFKDLNGRVWFTTSTGGLNILSQQNDEWVIRPYEHNYIIKGVSTDYITSMYQDKKGIYWLGSSGSGLMKWNERTKKVEVFNKKDGLPNNVVYGIAAGKEGSLWLSTNKGLCNIYPQTRNVKSYTEVDGLMSNEFNLGAYMESNSGTLYFGGIYGYNYFNPKDLVSARQSIEVVFTRFKTESQWLTPESEDSPLTKPIFETREIELNYKQRSFTIRFQASDLTNPERINYKYELEGSDEGEIFIGTQNEIHFSALSHGTYTLKVYARYGDNAWGEPAVMRITIATPLWLAWWFWVVVVAIALLMVRVIIRVRVEAARRDQVRLEMKIRDRTREIKEQNRKIESQKKKIEEERNKVIEQQRLLQIEKDKTERLLKNMMPESTAEELKKSGKARARAYKTVSVLFTDFVGFTKISDRMPATELVKKLDVYFTRFDEIIVKNNLEKIKTIGDAYMCAGGVPVRNNTNPIDACLTALQIQAYMLQRKNDALANNEEYWQLRLGINTGEVTAGVIGSERLAYDIWGSTVNLAQRMEMLGEPDRVTITGATFKHIEPYFECLFMGKAQTKSRGLIDMYVVSRIKPELSVNDEGILPNERFNQIVNLHLYSSINYYKAERHIMKVLEARLSKQLHYHSIAHTKDVVSAVERLAFLEGVTDEGLFLLKSAATYHDAGFVEAYDNNEPIGARLADEILPKYGYTEKHIDQIKKLIYVTQIPHKPTSKLEEIICDADLDYLGRDDFHEISDRLRLELMEHGKIKSLRHWDEIQVSFLTQHTYFTKTALRTRKAKKEQNLEEVKERLARNEYPD